MMRNRKKRISCESDLLETAGKMGGGNFGPLKNQERTFLEEVDYKMQEDNGQEEGHYRSLKIGSKEEPSKGAFKKKQLGCEEEGFRSEPVIGNQIEC